MTKPLDVDSLEELAYQLAREVQTKIDALDATAEYRRDFDGVSQGGYLIAKMIGEILTDGRAHHRGLVLCKEDYSD